ncbi:MAG TPA: heavy metal-binding domain-containing protein [Pyrodictium sp.]|nr:heavy metal-binding domain-containing protein [Pyrodictium sp.]
MSEDVLLLSIEQPVGYQVKELKGLIYASRPISLTVAGLEAELDAILEKLRHDAKKVGANAVLGLRIETRRVVGVGGEWVLLLAYGTAAVIEKEKQA